MSRRWSALVCLPLCVLLAACGSSGNLSGSRQTDQIRVRTIDSALSVEVGNASQLVGSVVAKSRSEVWPVLPAVFETLEVEPPSIDARTLVMGNPGYRPRRIEGKRLSTYLECGRSMGKPNADQYAVTLQFMVQSESAADGGTSVNTLMDATARSRALSGNTQSVVALRGR